MTIFNLDYSKLAPSPSPPLSNEEMAVGEIEVHIPSESPPLHSFGSSYNECVDRAQGQPEQLTMSDDGLSHYSESRLGAETFELRDCDALLRVETSGDNLARASECTLSQSPPLNIALPDDMPTRNGRNVLKRRRMNRCHQASRREVDGIVPKGKHSKTQVLIESALSTSAEQYPGDIIDPVAYAHRSAEDRRQKSAEEGKIARPLNSYMLYRKAYQQVARRILSNDQQQFASQIVGESWNRWEPKHIKAKFKDLAKIDHKKHHEAFPDYKYTPAQSKMSKAAPVLKDLSVLSRRRDQQYAGLDTGCHTNNTHDGYVSVCSQQLSCPEPWHQNVRDLSWPPGKDRGTYHDYDVPIPCSLAYMEAPPATYFYDRAMFTCNTDERGSAVTRTFEAVDAGSYIDPALIPNCADADSHTYPAQSLEWFQRQVPETVGGTLVPFIDYPAECLNGNANQHLWLVKPESQS